MVKKIALAGAIAGLGLVFGTVAPGAVAEMSGDGAHPSGEGFTGGFQRVEQPIANKIAVTLGGLGLIGLELGWFLWSKPKSRRATAREGIQEVTVTVDGGYEPSRIEVEAGRPVRLNFKREDASSCLEEIRFPDFNIVRSLPLHRVTAIEFLPEEPGRYEFTCGMNMYRGAIEARPIGTTTGDRT
ncbi:cupredoxin domain-containing protein [Pannus brasiliensis CCIBt3594]|uniref:Cupredoxin domain-containing protein n=1 Tax=Pannus brasiliensis CCIBt3594 TaxID=1427578 RepID=A0AAW9QQD1_9CHRO